MMLRPPRFGKTFLTMLDCYYNVAKKDAFESTFGDLAIMETPRNGELQSAFFVLRLSLPGAVQKNLESYEARFHTAVNKQIQERTASFIQSHAEDFGPFLPYEESDGFEKDPAGMCSVHAQTC